MSRARRVGVVGAAGALLVAFLAGTTLGGWWWIVVVLAAAGALGGRPGSLVHAVATLALAGGAAAEGAAWLVPLLVLGLVAAVEASALADQVDRTRTTVSVGPAVVGPVAAAGVAGAVLALAALAPGFAVPIALAAAVAATALLTTLRP